MPKKKSIKMFDLDRRTVENYHISFFSGLLASIIVAYSVGANLNIIRFTIGIFLLYFTGLLSIRLWYKFSKWENEKIDEEDEPNGDN